MSRIRSNRVCFTINHYKDSTPEAFLRYFETNKDRIQYAVVGDEIGDSGTEHLQGFIHIKEDPKKCGIRFWKAEIPEGERAHFEQARGTDEQNQDYCTKSGYYIETGETGKATDVWAEIYKATFIGLEEALNVNLEYGIKYYNQISALVQRNSTPKFDQKLKLRDWQQSALTKLENQTDRHILFVVDEEGGKGKSALAKHILTTKNAWACQGGGIRDLMHSYNPKAEYVVFDMARCNDAQYWPWNFMENLKNGWFTSTKYNGGMVMFNVPKIIVFTNQYPDKSKLSQDRYEIYKI